MTPTAETLEVRYLIVGAGPGGLQLAWFLDRAERDYLVVERADHAGAFFDRFPRHRTLISINKQHNWFPEPEFNERHDWNSLLSDDPTLRFTAYSEDLFPDADALCGYLRDFAERTDLRIRYGTEVTSIERPDDRFLVRTADGATIRAEVVVLATGASVERRPDIPGIEHTTSYGEHDTDVERYRNKRVGILGHGNSAFETADHLAGAAAYVHLLGAGPLTMAWDSHFPGHLRAINNSVLDMFQLKSMHAVLSPRVVRIDRDGDVLRTTHEYDYPTGATPGTLTLTRDYDEIICCTGFDWLPAHLFADDLRPATWKEGKFPSLTPAWESVNVPGLYVAGGAMQGNDRRSASGFIHGFRYNVRSLARILDERYEGVPYPGIESGPFEWDPFAHDLFRRLSTSAGLFQLFGTLGDEITISEDRSRVVRREELPVALLELEDPGEDHRFVVTLEFGFHGYRDPAVTFLGPSDPTATEHAAFLHPVVRYRRGDIRREFHLADSLLGRWDLPHATGGAVMPYHEAFRRWFLGCLGDEVPAPDADLDGAFRPWSDEEIEAWREAHPVAEDPRRSNPLATGVDNARRRTQVAR
ncbi:MAG: NAD(P)-binding domain-containing protein [Acidimicrobiales bacterium]